MNKVMKCDELKFERLGDANETYPASTLVIRKQFVDAAIDELKREHHRERDEYIDWVNKLQKENAELKRRDTEHTVHIAKMNADLRKTQRALWLAREERALSEQYVISNAVLYLENKFNHKFNSVRHELHVWGVVKRKCRAKAEQYK